MEKQEDIEKWLERPELRRVIHEINLCGYTVFDRVGKLGDGRSYLHLGVTETAFTKMGQSMGARLAGPNGVPQYPFRYAFNYKQAVERAECLLSLVLQNKSKSSQPQREREEQFAKDWVYLKGTEKLDEEHSVLKRVIDLYGKKPSDVEQEIIKKMTQLHIKNTDKWLNNC